MSLLDSIAQAELTVVDEELRLVYAWFGGPGVEVFDEDGRTVHHFTIAAGFTRKLTPQMVRAAIARVRQANDE